jgi:hypothetical protein
MEDKDGDNNEQSSLLDYYTGFRWGGEEGFVSPPPPHIHKVASVTIYAKTTLYRSPSSSMIHKLVLVGESEAKGEKLLPGQQIFYAKYTLLHIVT